MNQLEGQLTIFDAIENTMRPIPPKLRDDMAEDPYYKKCCLHGVGYCDGKIEWHHQIIYASKQWNKKWAILPICHFHHDHARETIIKERLQCIALNRASDTELLEISKATNYISERTRLNKIYG